MFLVSRSIYFSIRKNLSDGDKLEKLNQLNTGSNYIENAIQYNKHKSYKSPTVSETVTTFNKTLNSSINSNEDSALTNEGGLDSALAHDEQAPLTDTVATSSPIVSGNEPSQLVPIDEGINELTQPLPPPPLPPLLHLQQHRTILQNEPEVQPTIADANPSSSQVSLTPESYQDIYIRTKQKIFSSLSKLDENHKLACPFCPNKSFSRFSFFDKHMHLKHGYELSPNERRLAEQTLKKAPRKKTFKPRQKDSMKKKKKETMIRVNLQRTRPSQDRLGKKFPWTKRFLKNTNWK